MASNRKRQPSGTPAAGTGKRTFKTAMVLLGLVVVGLTAAYALRGRRAPAPPGSPASAAGSQASGAGAEAAAGPAEAAEPAADEQPQEEQEPAGPRPPQRPVRMETLAGSWVRTDGQYVIQVESVASDGTLKAAYFNPQPIRVAKAKASRSGDALEMFVELRDVGYPGCTYRLTYQPEQDALLGVYFQAAMGEEYQVAFARLSR